VTGRRRHGDPRDRDTSAAGLPGYHDPLAGYGGAAPARSALTLRLVLACFGLVVCGAGGGGLVVVGAPPALSAVVLLLAAAAAVDLAVVGRRLRRGEPG
jgi:hypothetical protein